MCLFVAKVLEPVAILRRIDKSKDHVTEISRIGVQSVDPILEPNRIRVASQVAEVLHRHKATIEELVKNRLTLNYRSENLCPCLRTTVEGRDQISFV